MKKKVNVTFQVQYETEIEVDTDLPEGTYELDCEELSECYDRNDNLIDITETIIDSVTAIIESKEVFDIELPMSQGIFYREDSFEVVNIIV